MIKKMTSPPAIMALLMLTGATAIPTAIGMGNSDIGVINSKELLQLGIGVFALGAVLITFLLIFRIWRWEHFARVRAVGEWWLFALMNIATIALYPAYILYFHILSHIYPALQMQEVIHDYAIVGAWSLNTINLIVTNVLFVCALPHTTLPAPMRVRYSGSSKELNAWRAIFAIFFLADIIYLAICINVGAVTGVLSAIVYMYVLFALHAGKVEWKEEMLKRKYHK